MSSQPALYYANNFIKQALKERKTLNLRQLHGLLYALYKHALKEHKLILFNDLFEVWASGAVIAPVYHIFLPQQDKILEPYFDKQGNHYTTVVFGKRTQASFDWVWHTYKDLSPSFIHHQFTQNANSAWNKARQRKDRFLNQQDIYDEPYWIRC